MKKILLGWLLVLGFLGGMKLRAGNGNDGLYNDRPDLYGPPVYQWNYTVALTTTVVKTSPGVLHNFSVFSTSTHTLTLADATTAAGCLVQSSLIALFTGINSTGTYDMDVRFNTGLVVCIPNAGISISSVPFVTVSWR